ncbi:MAG: hypothetical protein AMJ88_08640 [Anaerolineae bacterium SM23_ 63]|nr:MAG: hypothetical protein AMJ88_08640 [Anaerolineae bacterium SM23_ 63]HEY48081.1 hypothetical protein [Anaerolineae bacterium]
MKYLVRYKHSIVVLLIVSVILGACSTTEGPQAEDILATSVAQTLTAISPAATETGTPEPTPPLIEKAVEAWYGYVLSLPTGDPFDDRLILVPEGVGEFGLVGSNSEIEAEIEALRDKSEPANKAHFWGVLTCGVEDYGGCRLVVERLRPDGPGPFFEPDIVKGWEGVVYAGPPGPRSGGDDYFALVGDYHVQYGIWSEDETLSEQIEGLRDTNNVIFVWGELVAGVPDWNGTQIQVTQIDVVDRPSGPIPPPPEWSEIVDAWWVYVNEDVGYQFEYPAVATVMEFEVMGFPTDELPEGMSIDEYIAQLQEQYGNSLCVHVKYSLGYVSISAPENVGYRYVICGRTGVGVGEIKNKVELVDIDGRIYEATGFEFIGDGETLDNHNETFFILLDDGTRIEYGAGPASDATYEDYLLGTKEVLLQILASFEMTR